jgi:uncharacterized heparinase superfamily protein
MITFGVGVPSSLSCRGLDAVQGRHPNVHQHDVRMLVAAHADGFLAVRGRAHDREIGLGLEQRCEPGPDDLLVVDHDRADRHRAGT